jgi:hypothetical protein
MTKYAICPGFVDSKNDQDTHYITAKQLIRLYNVNPNECIILDTDAFMNDRHSEKTRGYSEDLLNELIYLTPRYDGNYKVPNN